MTRRMWMWVGGLCLVGVAFLLAAIRAHSDWTPPSDGQAVLTLNQLMGFVVSGALLIAAFLIVLTGVRRDRDRRRRQHRMRAMR